MQASAVRVFLSTGAILLAVLSLASWAGEERAFDGEGISPGEFPMIADKVCAIAIYREDEWGDDFRTVESVSFNVTDRSEIASLISLIDFSVQRDRRRAYAQDVGHAYIKLDDGRIHAYSFTLDDWDYTAPKGNAAARERSYSVRSGSAWKARAQKP
jgi:hypothetical protein